MEAKVGKVVVPGDYLPSSYIKDIDSKLKVILGPGLRRSGEHIYIYRAGILRQKNTNTFWVDYYQKRYVPIRGECVIGVVANKSSDILKVDIGAYEQASLPFLAFVGASKKYKPDVNVGDLVYAKLSVASADMEPELVCVDSNLKQGRYGVLQDGFVFTTSLNLVHKILNPKCPLLRILGREIKFEITAGMNGKIWIKTSAIQDTIAVANAILYAEFLSDEDMMTLKDEIISHLKGFPLQNNE